MFEYKEIYSTLAGTKYEGKCPDLNVDGEWYEHEGFVSQNPKRAFRNMLNDGLTKTGKQAYNRPAGAYRRLYEARDKAKGSGRTRDSRNMDKGQKGHNSSI